VGIGSNLGDRRSNLCGAARFLCGRPQVTDIRLSSIYETDPWGTVEGGRFLNCVFAGSFHGTPELLLLICREAELLAGSPTEKQGAARALDMDILCMDGIVRSSPPPVLPHPRLHLRRFVLEPLSEVWQGDVPGTGATPASLLLHCPDRSSPEPVEPRPPAGSPQWRCC